MGNCQKQQELFDTNGPRNGPIDFIRVTNYEWTKDYQGLFDYQSTSINKKIVKVNDNVLLGKYKGSIVLHKDNLGTIPKNELENCYFRMLKKEQYYQINPIMLEDENYTLQKLLWLVVKSVPNKSYTIQQRDIIKLGKQKLRVRQLVRKDLNPSVVLGFDNIKVSKKIYEDLTYKSRQPIQKELQLSKKFLSAQQKDERDDVSVVTSSQRVCRICLDPGQNTNPLITPCKCSGSVKYIHLKCLQMWLAKRLQTSKNMYSIIINWQPLACEMCKSHFKYRIYLDNKKFYTVQIPKPQKPYIVLEIVRKSSSQKGKLFYFISLAEKKKLSLGRRKDIDVRVSQDISVSRNHAAIEYDQDRKQFILTDNNSKFGTLVLIKKNLLIRPKHSGLSFQVGAQVFSFQAIRGQGEKNYVEQDEENFLAEMSQEQQQVDEVEQGESEEGQQNGDIQIQSPQRRLSHVDGPMIQIHMSERQ